MTRFSPTGTSRSGHLAAVVVASFMAVLACGAGPSSAATMADLAGPLRDLALGESPAAARLANVQAGRVHVEVLFKTPADATRSGLETLGARVHNRRDRRLEALVPVARLQDLALLPSVAQVALVTRVYPLQGTGLVLSEGVQLTNAFSLQVNGITGLGAAVAVIDLGFLGYAAAELPANVTARSFRADGRLDDGNHGTACAEVIADMAPEVDMSLLAVASAMDVQTALDWCLQNGIDIVSMSIGTFEGPFDGRAAVDRTVDRVRAGGVLVCASAGNQAQQHWAGDAVLNQDNYVEFDTNDDGVSIQLTGAGVVDAWLSWFETAGPNGERAEVTNRDYDLLLVGGGGQTIARSAVTQNGDDPPSERLVALVSAVGTYNIKILAVSSNISSAPPDHFQLFVPNIDIEPPLQVPEGSLAIPAEADGALTVGATRGVFPLTLPPIVDYPIDTLEPFSSQGPTVDGRHKPDICGPDAVDTSLGTRPNPVRPFLGTSAACPHVAGGAALLVSESASRTADQVESVLLRLAQQQNDLFPVTLPDNTEGNEDQRGAGRLSLRAGLDTEPPLVSISFPRNGTTITTAQPEIVGVVNDAQTGVDDDLIILTLDSVQIPRSDFSFTASSGVVAYTPPSELSRSAHTVTLQATDLAGNQSQPAVSNFRVGLPTLSAGLHLISLPYRNLINSSPSSIFGVPLSEVALFRWVPTDASFNKYRVYPDPLASFTPPDAFGSSPTVPDPPAGLGYFVNLPRQVVLSIFGDSLAAEPSYTIRLPFGSTPPTGWHMIGNPYQETLDWATVQFRTRGVTQDLDEAITAGVTEGILFEYVPAAGGRAGHYAFVPALTAVLEPMNGYWLHVRKETEVIIYAAAVSGSSHGRATPAKQEAPSRDDWRLQLVASGPNLLDLSNYLGVAPTASTGHDIAADVPEPPPLGEGLSLYFPHADWGEARGNYTQDMQARGAAAQTWALEVACPKKSVSVTLSWPELNAATPNGLTFRLEDVDGGRTTFMRTTTGYTYNSGNAGVRHFKVVAESGQGGGLRILSLDAAAVRGGHVEISYQLALDASVTAEIRNIAGRPVRGLVARREAPAGRNALAWDTRSDAGVLVPAGTYLLHLTAQSPDGQAAQRLCPVRVVR